MNSPYCIPCIAHCLVEINRFSFDLLFPTALTSPSLHATIGPSAKQSTAYSLCHWNLKQSTSYFLCHWNLKQSTSYSLRHWNLRNLTLQQDCYLTNTRDLFYNTHGSIMLPPRQPRVFARLGSLANILFKSNALI